jgi:hypothetical protein
VLGSGGGYLSGPGRVGSRCAGRSGSSFGCERSGLGLGREPRVAAETLKASGALGPLQQRLCAGSRAAGLHLQAVCRVESRGASPSSWSTGGPKNWPSPAARQRRPRSPPRAERAKSCQGCFRPALLARRPERRPARLAERCFFQLPTPPQAPFGRRCFSRLYQEWAPCGGCGTQPPSYARVAAQAQRGSFSRLYQEWAPCGGCGTQPPSYARVAAGTSVGSFKL